MRFLKAIAVPAIALGAAGVLFAVHRWRGASLCQAAQSGMLAGSCEGADYWMK